MSGEKKSRIVVKSVRFVIIVILLVGFVGLSAFAVMSDNSIHGLTLRFYGGSGNVLRSCNLTGTQPIVTFRFFHATVYSSNSLTVSLSHIIFAMSADGLQVGTTTAQDTKFDPGHSYSFYLTFSNSTLDPHSQPPTSQIVLSINAQASAGLFSGQASASDSQTIQFGSPPC